jgi:hypothetical protein
MFCGTMLTASIQVSKKPALLSKGDPPKCAVSQIIRDANAPVFNDANKTCPGV